MAQKTYLDRPAEQGPGKLADIAPSTKRSLKNTTGAEVPFGVFVAIGAADDRLKRLTGTSDVIAGLTLFDHVVNSALGTYPPAAVAFGETDTNEEGVADKRMAAVLRSGYAWARCEEAVAIGDPVYARVTAAGAEINGAVRNDPDGGDCILIKGARFASTSSAAGVALVELVGDLDALAQGTSGPLLITLTPGAEAAQAIDVVGAITDAAGNAVTTAQEVWIESLAVTADKGDLAAASSAVGTVVKANNPATGPNTMTMTTTAAGLFSFKVSNDVAEVTHVTVRVDGGLPRVIKLTFA